MLHDKPGTVTYFGCVGKDQYAADLKAAANKDGLRVEYQVDAARPTGTCAVLITGKNRYSLRYSNTSDLCSPLTTLMCVYSSMVANLGAANHFAVEHVEQKQNWGIVEQAQFYYISAFFLTSSPASIMKVARHAAEKNKVLAILVVVIFPSQRLTFQCCAYVKHIRCSP